MKRLAILGTIMALLVYGGVTWGVDDETVLLRKESQIFWMGGPAGSAADGSEAGYGPDYLLDIENALYGDLQFTPLGVPAHNDTVSSDSAGLTFVVTHTLESAGGNDHNWFDTTAAYAWVGTQTTSTLTLVYDPVNRTPDYVDGVATMTITATGDMGDTGTLVVKFNAETLMGSAVSTGTAVTWNTVP